jgi:ClpP class serine protease
MLDELSGVFDVSQDETSELNDDLCAISKKNNAVIMSIVAPYVGERMSPTKLRNVRVTILDEFSVESAIEKIQTNTDCRKLILLLNSPGGSIPSSYKIARALRYSFKEITIFVPHIAASGGTLIALTGNSIVMGMMSQLSPLDPLLAEADGRTVPAKIIVDAHDELTRFFKVTTLEDAPYTQKILADKYNPTEIQEARSIMAIMERYIHEILIKSGYDEPASSKITKNLVYGFLNHEEIINEDIGKQIGLKIINSDKFPMEWAILKKWLGSLLIKNSGTHIISYYMSPALRKN